MKKTSILCALTFAVVFTTGTAKAVEPSEKEMLSALQGILDEAGQQANDRSEQCKYIRESNDPYLGKR